MVLLPQDIVCTSIYIRYIFFLFMAKIRTIYLPIKKSYRKHRGLAERIVRRDFMARGWEVWRGGMIGSTCMPDAYPHVRKKYLRLLDLLDVHAPHTIDSLSYLSQVHHGMPDFICYKDVFLFVECKFLYEPLSLSQERCIRTLLSLGFQVEIYRIAGIQTKILEAHLDITTGELTPLAVQTTMKGKYGFTNV